MPRSKIDLPSAFNFQTEIPIRITDVNYGGHVGNDSILSIIHEARMQFLLKAGLSEKGADGQGLIMRDVTIEFSKEAFYGDKLQVQVAAMNFQTASYDIVYRIQRGAEIVAMAKTGMVSFDYNRKRISPLASETISRLGLGAV